MTERKEKVEIVKTYSNEIMALAEFLGMDPKEAEKKLEKEKYIVATDEEADKKKVRRVRYTDRWGVYHDIYIKADKLPSGWSTKWTSPQWLYVREMLHTADDCPVRVGRSIPITSLIDIRGDEVYYRGRHIAYYRDGRVTYMGDDDGVVDEDTIRRLVKTRR